MAESLNSASTWAESCSPELLTKTYLKANVTSNEHVLNSFQRTQSIRGESSSTEWSLASILGAKKMNCGLQSDCATAAMQVLRLIYLEHSNDAHAIVSLVFQRFVSCLGLRHLIDQ